MELDKQQKKAIEHPEQPMAISAGAGSGKTRVLVERYMEIILTGAAKTDEILAITFTKKAAAELKSRVRERLIEVINKPASNTKKNFAESALATIESAPISTIHSFCQSVLKSYSLEAGLEPSFRVLESNESSIIADQVIRRVVSEFLRGEEESGRTLIRYIGLPGVRSLSETALRDRYRLSGALSRVSELAAAGKLEEAVEDMFNEEFNEFFTAPELTVAFENLSECVPLNDTDAIAKIRLKVLDARSKLQDGTPMGSKLDILFEIAGSIVLKAGSKSSWENGEFKQAKESLKIIRNRVLEFIPGGKESVRLADIDILSTLHMGAKDLTEKIFREYDSVLSGAAALDYNGLLHKTMTLLREKRNIADHYRMKFKQVLVDEFQDTDDLQMEIIKTLIRGEDKPPVLFMVGDENQSIYKFRGAEVSNFRKMMHDTGIEKPEHISNNYRSQPELIDFFNSFFSNFLKVSGGDSDGSYVIAQKYRKSHNDDPKIQLLMPVLEEDEEKTVREAEAKIIAGQILSLVGNKTIIGKDGKKRKIEFRDIGMLFQRFTQIQPYLDGLKESGVPFYVKSSRGFFNSFEIMDLLNFFRAIEYSGDDYSLASWLRSPIVGLSDNALFLLGAGGSFISEFKNSTLSEKFSGDDKSRMNRAVTLLSEMREAKDTVGVSRFVQKVIDEISYIPFLLASENGEQKALNVYKLLEIISNLENSGANSFGGLLDMIDRITSLDIREGEATLSAEEDNVVSILSVHGAKGLQFPVVILPDLNAQVLHPNKPVRYDTNFGIGFRLRESEDANLDPLAWLLQLKDKKKDEFERKRILYVAMTRARDYLFLASAREKKGDTLSPPRSGTWLQQILDGLDVGHEEEIEEIHYSGLKIPVIREIEAPSSDPQKSAPPKLPPGFEKSINYVKPIEIERELSKLTPTGLLAYEECEWKYSLKELDGVKEPELNRPQGSEASSGPGGPKFGEMAHKLFERTDFKIESTGSEIEKIIGEYNIEKDKSAVYAQELQRIIEEFRKTEIFEELIKVDSEDIKREEPFFFNFEDVLIEGTIDLMYRSGDGWILLDYKTDRVEGKRIDEKVEYYKSQLLIYAKAIHAIQRELPLKTLIYFTHSGVIKDLKVNDKTLSEFDLRLKSVLNSLKNGKFEKNPASCDKCGFYGTYCNGV
ncbi:MAG: UvrD-helicase domain-containing protein [Candidatus Marinimicrobia bacterium]|nr:UvrD-helicase domain-containing protein [Candidatus Neomarinimicrobiota bacterium]